MIASSIEADDLIDCIKQFSLDLEREKNLTGQARRNHKSHLRKKTRTLLDYVATHQRSCTSVDCDCHRLAQFCPGEVLHAVPDLANDVTGIREVVTFPAYHAKACKDTWDRSKSKWYCVLSCEDKHDNWDAHTSASCVSPSEASNQSSKLAAAALTTTTGNTNDCGCEKRSAKMFRKANEINFSHDDDMGKCIEDVIQYLKKRGGQKRRRIQ